MIRRVQMIDSIVDSSKIDADTIIAADVDETTPYNFTNTASTWVGALSRVASAEVNSFSGTVCTITQLKAGGTGTGYYIGQFVFPAASTSTVVPNTVVTANSKVFISYKSDPVVRYYASALSASTSFTLTASSAPAAASTIDYMIVN